MIDVAYRGDMVTFTPRGWSRLWTLGERVTVPLNAIRAVRRAPPGVGRGIWKGWRMPGTHIPGVVVAGSYYKDGGWSFWDVRGSGARAIEVEVEGRRYTRLVIDVDDPDAEVTRLSAAIAR